MRDDDKFNKNFVKRIETFKCLYDYTRSDYKNVHIQEKAWADIAEEFKESVSSCKERWRNLRGCYTRHLKHKTKCETARYRKPYYLASYMNFIYPFTKSRGSSSSTNTVHNSHTESQNDVKCENSFTIAEIADSGEVEEQQNSMEESIQNQSVEDEWSTDRGQQDDNITINQSNQKRLDHIIITCKDDHALLSSDSNQTPVVASSTSLPLIDPTSQILSQLSQSTKRQIEEANPLQKFQIIQEEAPESGNADLYFLKSLLPDLQSMCPAQKRKLRIGFLHVIDGILSET